MSRNLALPVFTHASARPEGIALRVDGASYTYADLAAYAQAIRDRLWELSPDGPRRIAVVGGRTLESYLGILGTCWSGAAYVPVSPKLPPARLQQVLEIVAPDAVLVDAEGAAALADLALCPVLSLGELAGARAFREPDTAAGSDAAYIIFTSGSTGTPKGVVLALSSVRQYLTMMQNRYQLGPGDTVAQPCELGFDVSMSNIFMAWQAGATLAVVPASQAMAPRDFIRAERPTFWFSTPAPALFLEQMKMLRPGIFPSLRYSCFAGDVLPASMAERWAEAAPHSVIDNLYGQTEATVVCAGARYTGADVVTPGRGTISFGPALPGSELMVADEAGNELPNGTPGELLLAGPQLALGYWNDDELTARRFPVIAGKRRYRSGDLVYRDEHGSHHFLGRIDDQVKVRGFRVELGEIEAHMREVCASNSVVAVPWPVRLGSASGIVAFISGTQRSPLEVRQALKDRLPSYLIPSQIRALDALPLGLAGKFDRRALTAILEKEA